MEHLELQTAASFEASLRHSIGRPRLSVLLHFERFADQWASRGGAAEIASTANCTACLLFAVVGGARFLSQNKNDDQTCSSSCVFGAWQGATREGHRPKCFRAQITAEA